MLAINDENFFYCNTVNSLPTWGIPARIGKNPWASIEIYRNLIGATTNTPLELWNVTCTEQGRKVRVIHSVVLFESLNGKIFF